jgi:hypothetical protein
MALENEKEYIEAMQVRGYLGQTLTDAEMLSQLRGKQLQVIADLYRVNTMSVKRITELLTAELFSLDELIEYQQEKVNKT